MDLYLEYLNSCLKTSLRNIGSNITDNSVQLAAQSIALIEHVCQQFQAVTANKTPSSNKHSSPSFESDFKMILNVLQQQEVFVYKESREYTTFKFHKRKVNFRRCVLLMWPSGLNRPQIPYSSMLCCFC